MLTSRRIGKPAIGVLECPKCAGLWLAAEELKILLRRSRDTSADSEFPEALDPQSYQSTNRVQQNGPLYRACPICAQLMHRRNYGRKSGIIIDHCASHGYWFDSHELESILQWVRKGGEQRVARLEEDERRETDRRQELERHLDPVASEWPTTNRSSGPLTDLLRWLVGQVLYR